MDNIYIIFVGYIYLELFFKFIITYLFCSLIEIPIVYTISVYFWLTFLPYKLVLIFFKKWNLQRITSNIELPL